MMVNARQVEDPAFGDPHKDGDGPASQPSLMRNICRNGAIFGALENYFDIEALSISVHPLSDW